MKTTIGGDRLGSGGKQEVAMKNYERSTHDLGYIWRSSMASGTLVPFMSELGLPGDSWDIDLQCDVKTLPTVGPLFGSYKVQLDIFTCPVRLYQGKLHMNMLNIGMDMSEVLLPQIQMETNAVAKEDLEYGDNEQINASSVFSYLNMRGIGVADNNKHESALLREFNAISYLSMWDIYKNYYANKQEEEGVVIHAGDLDNKFEVYGAEWNVYGVDADYTYNIFSVGPITADNNAQGATGVAIPQIELMLYVRWQNTGQEYGEPDPLEYIINFNNVPTRLGDLFVKVTNVRRSTGVGTYVWDVKCTGYTGIYGNAIIEAIGAYVDNKAAQTQLPPRLQRFPLKNIDDMRMDILKAVDLTTALKINKDTYAPYGLALGNNDAGLESVWYKEASQEGLPIKTYQSDLFNNWISTEWIDGSNGINEITSVDTSSGSFTIDSVNLANKVYTMLNRIAISGGTYDDWLDAVYTHERARGQENPVYQGSLIKELSFEEVVSNVDSEVGGETQPLGTLAGRGRLTGKTKGGRIRVKCDEPSYIMGIVSLTPRVDYSQGNKWDTNLKSLNDFHKPELGAIGFQDLVTDQMAWFDTEVSELNEITYKSAGKQPAWINYMTNVNQTRGSFAEADNSMFMTLNRRYEQSQDGIVDVTTYVDPSKYNNIFAQTSIDSQNFWVQIGLDIKARRKMSAKVIPNL